MPVLGVTAVAAWMAATVVFLGTQDPPSPGTGADATAGHFLLFGPLGFLTSAGVLVMRPSARLVVVLATALLVGGLWALLTEWYQTTLPGRDGALADGLVDMAGVTVGALVAYLGRLWTTRRPCRSC